MVTVAAIQMVSCSEVAVNLDAAAELVGAAARQGAQLIVLPENFACYGRADTSIAGEAESAFDGPISQFLSRLAKSTSTWLVGGTIPCAVGLDGSCAAPGKAFAAQTVWAPDGELKARYDKIHLFDADVSDSIGSYRESDRLEPGSRPVCVETPWGAMGLATCYDLRFPEYFRLLREHGARLVTLPSAFTYSTGEAHWEVLLRARAIENQVFMIGANQGGDHGGGRRTWGHSSVISPWGELIAGASGQGPQPVLAQLDLAQLEEVRQRMPVIHHRRF